MVNLKDVGEEGHGSAKEWVESARLLRRGRHKSLVFVILVGITTISAAIASEHVSGAHRSSVTPAAGGVEVPATTGFSVSGFGELSTDAVFAQGSFGVAVTSDAGRKWQVHQSTDGTVAGGVDLQHLLVVASAQSRGVTGLRVERVSAAGRTLSSTFFSCEPSGCDGHVDLGADGSAYLTCSCYSGIEDVDGDANVLFVSRDAGNHWRRVARLPNLGTLVFTSATTGWSASGNGWTSEGTGAPQVAGLALFRTTDGGRTWIAVSLPVPQRFADATVALGTPSFASPSVGFVPAEVSVRNAADGTPVLLVFRTTNGGESWTVLTPQFPSATPRVFILGFPQSFDGVASMTGAGTFVVGLGSWLYVTSDRGASWHRAATPVGYEDPVGIEWIAPSTGLITYRDAIYRSIDGGVHWSVADPR